MKQYLCTVKYWDNSLMVIINTSNEAEAKRKANILFKRKIYEDVEQFIKVYNLDDMKLHKVYGA